MSARRRCRLDRPPRRCAQHERGRVRMGTARRRNRDLAARCPARRRVAGRGVEPAPRHDRRSRERRHGDPGRPRPQRGAPGIVLAASRRRREGPHEDHRVLVAIDRPDSSRLAQRSPFARDGPGRDRQDLDRPGDCRPDRFRRCRRRRRASQPGCVGGDGARSRRRRTRRHAHRQGASGAAPRQRRRGAATRPRSCQRRSGSARDIRAPRPMGSSMC